MSEDKIFAAVNMMMQTDKMHRCLLESKVRGLGMHITSHRALMHLARCDKLLSQKELAERLSITPAAVTGVLKRLESDKYIERRLGTDNRFNEITITQKGRDTVNATHSAFGSLDRALFDSFSEEELESYIRCLEKMQANMKKQYSNER